MGLRSLQRNTVKCASGLLLALAAVPAWADVSSSSAVAAGAPTDRMSPWLCAGHPGDVSSSDAWESIRQAPWPSDGWTGLPDPPLTSLLLCPPHAAGGFTAWLGNESHLEPAWLLGAGRCDPATSEDQPARLSTPDGPGGAFLALSGLLLVGGGRWIRSLRGTDWQHLPDWYQVGGPCQIGHAHASADTHSLIAAVLPAPFDRPVRLSIRSERAPDAPPGHPSQDRPASAAPRAPPACRA